MSYKINTLFIKIKTNIEDIPIIDPVEIKHNNYDLSKIFYLKNIKLTNQNIDDIYNSKTGFSNFNLEQIAIENTKDNIINKDDDFSKENIGNIFNKIFYQGRKLVIENENYVIGSFEWNKKLNKNYETKSSMQKDYEFSTVVTLKLLQKEEITTSDKRNIKCDNIYDEIRKDTRDIFVKKTNKTKKDNTELPVAKPLNGGKRKYKTKKYRQLKKRTKKIKKGGHHEWIILTAIALSSKKRRKRKTIKKIKK